jgi:hypothetical protein
MYANWISSEILFAFKLRIQKSSEKIWNISEKDDNCLRLGLKGLFFYLPIVSGRCPKQSAYRSELVQ